MSRRRAATLIAGALAAAVLAAACKRTAPAGAAEPAHVADVLLDRLPADTEVVAAAALGELADSPVVRRAVAVLAHEAPGLAELVVTRCGLDPWAAIEAVAFVATAGEDDSRLVARLGADQDRLHACLAALRASGDAEVEVETRGRLTAYLQPESVELAAWVDPSTVLVLPDRLDDAEALLAALAPAAPPRRLADLAGRVDRGATAWAVVVPAAGGDLAEMLAAVPLARPPWGVHASLRRQRGLRLTVGAVFASAADADAGAALLRRLADDPPPALARWRDALAIEPRGDEVRVVLALDAAGAAELEAQLADVVPPAPTRRPAPPPAPPP
jgi:hypothetical protein